MHTTTHLWSFALGISILLGHLKKVMTQEYKHILATIDYFSKRAETN